MRPVALVLLVALLAGCAAEDPPASSATVSPPPPGEREPRDMFVVSVTSELARTRTDAGGAEWTPPFPGVHGCRDEFTIDADSERVLVDDWPRNVERVDAARALLAMQSRWPTSFYRNSVLTLPATLPHQETIAPMGSTGADTHPIVIGEGSVLVDGRELAPGTNATFTIEYDWTGTVRNATTGTDEPIALHVVETVTVTNHGFWHDPIELRERMLCI